MLLDLLDEKDASIVRLLREDARASTSSLAERLGLPRVTVHDRIKRLQDRGVIDRFTVQLSREELGFPLHGFILANAVSDAGRVDRRKVASDLCKLPFVVGVNIITGQWDFLIEVIATEMDSLGDSILDQFSGIEGIGQTQTMISFYEFHGAARTN